MRLFPRLLQPCLFWLLPSYWKGQRYLAKAKTVLGPHIRALLEKSAFAADGVSSELAPSQVSVIAWLADVAKDEARDPDLLAHVAVLLALASVHTTLLRMVNVLYDLIDNPLLLDEVREEASVSQIFGKPEHLAVSRSSTKDTGLPKLDSILRESQRISPPTILGLKRYFTDDHMFSNGLHVPAGSYVCLPTFAIENDPSNARDPPRFDGLRSYRQLQQPSPNGSTGDSEMEMVRNRLYQDQHAFTAALNESSLNFGFGKTACPGRFFASTVLKIVFVQLLGKYDFRFAKNGHRPRNFIIHEFLFPWPWSKIEFRRRQA